MKKTFQFTAISLDSLRRDNLAKIFIPLLVVGLPLMSTNLTLDPGLPVRFLGLAILIVAMATLLIFGKGQSVSLKNPLLIVLALFVIYGAFRISGKYVFSDSLFVWLKSMLYLLLVLECYLLFGFEAFRKAMTWSFAVLGVIITIWGIVELQFQISDNHLEVPTDTYHIKACFEHRNLYAQALLFTLVFQLALALSLKNKWFNIIFLIAATFNLFMVIVLANRAVWLAAAVSLLVFSFLLWFLRYRDPSRPKQSYPLLKLFAVFIISLLMSIIFYQVYALEDKMVDHAISVLDTETGSGEDRTELWDRTVKLVLEKPLIGHGLANWKIEILKYGNRNLLSEDNITFYQRPHNDFLWVASEMGMIGLLLYLLIFILTFIIAVKVLRKKSAFEHRVYLGVVISLIVAYLIFSFFSFPMERIVQNTFVSLLIASVMILRNEESMDAAVHPGKGKRLIYLIIGAIGIGAIVVGGYRFIGEANLNEAIAAKDRKEYEQMNSYIDRSSNLFYQMDPTSTPLNWYSGFAFYQMSEYDMAIARLKEARKQNPFHIHVLNNLGSSYMKTGVPDSAIYYYREALNVAPEFEESKFNLSAVLYNIGEFDQAYEVFRTIPYSTSDTRFRPFLKSILTSKITTIFPEGSLPELPADESWYYALHKIAIDDSTSIENLIFAHDLFIPNE